MSQHQETASVEATAKPVLPVSAAVSAASGASTTSGDESSSELSHDAPGRDTPEQLTLLERFSKTSAAANLTGSFNEAAGAIKRKLGQLTDDPELNAEGRDQQLLGKVYHLVGDLRDIRNLTNQKMADVRVELKKMVREHGGNFLDAASKLLADVKSKLS